MVRRGELWTARQAEQELGLSKGTVDVWVQRGYLVKAEIPGRPYLVWSDDVFDCQLNRRQRVRRAGTSDLLSTLNA